MKLLLTSAGFKNPKIGIEFLKLVGKPAKDIKIFFIPTASRYPEELEYVDISRQELFDLGISEDNLYEFNLKKRRLSDIELQEFDAIYVCGGNTFYLLDRLRQTRFITKIKELVKRGKVYAGVSAGSILAGPNIELAGWGSEGDKNDINLEDLRALNFTDIAIFPHYRDELKKELDSFRKRFKYRIVNLTNNQALLINGKEEKVIE